MESPNYIPLKNLEVYQIARQLSTMAWNIYSKMNFEDKKHIGDQFIRSVDSVGANISEGFGRYHYKDSKNFYYYSRGSLYETKTWLTKAFNRKLITEEKFKSMVSDINIIGIKLNNYINSIGKKNL